MLRQALRRLRKNMEHSITPVKFTLAGRELSLIFNARAWRLISERTGCNWLREQAAALEVAMDLETKEERQAQFAKLMGAALQKLLSDSVNLPVVLWATGRCTGTGSKFWMATALSIA